MRRLRRHVRPASYVARGAVCTPRDARRAAFRCARRAAADATIRAAMPRQQRAIFHYASATRVIRHIVTTIPCCWLHAYGIAMTCDECSAIKRSMSYHAHGAIYAMRKGANVLIIRRKAYSHGSYAPPQHTRCRQHAFTDHATTMAIIDATSDPAKNRWFSLATTRRTA